MNEMTVALFKIRENGSGSIEIYKVNAEEFENKLMDNYPTSEEDWWSLAAWVEENGELINKIRPDYSISLTYF